MGKGAHALNAQCSMFKKLTRPIKGKVGATYRTSHSSASYTFLFYFLLLLSKTVYVYEMKVCTLHRYPQCQVKYARFPRAMSLDPNEKNNRLISSELLRRN